MCCFLCGLCMDRGGDQADILIVMGVGFGLIICGFGDEIGCVTF